jgi:hypothetical protein
VPPPVLAFILGGGDMAGWRVEYEGLNRKVRTVHLTLSDEYETARDVQVAIQNGEIAGVKVKAGSLVLVQKYNTSTMGAA